MDQSEFGKLVDLDQTAISAVEGGKSDIMLRTLYNLADLDCSPNWLLFGDGPMSYKRTPIHRQRWKLANGKTKLSTSYASTTKWK